MNGNQDTFPVMTKLRPVEVERIDDFARREGRSRAKTLAILIRAGMAQMAGAGLAATGAQAASPERAPLNA